MSYNPATDEVLVHLRQAVRAAYGSRLERLVLYGSRARGDARVDSDYDVAVFLHGANSRADDLNRLGDIATDLLYADGAVVHVLPYRAGSYQDRSPLMHEIRREGIDL